MKLISFPVKNWQLTLLMFIMTVVVGLNTLFNMPRAEDPEINPPQFPGCGGISRHKPQGYGRTCGKTH
jgi:hypothetical protein